MNEIHYDAFISYRHVPGDIRTASEIQKQLEHFRVPAAIRKQTGRSRIGRVFRDREELPVTSDLQDSIAYALDHSDFLIVICSPDTKGSAWVQREISFFLRTHDSSRVLTVLSGGDDPSAVIPEILLSEERDGKIIPREPLSCDYRGNRKKARRDELPRLASAILGCSYDDLKQRQRQYRTRRMLSALAAALVLVTAGAGYLLWSRGQIRGNLRRSQISESRFLANAAMDEYRDGNRILAARLALEALPSKEDPDRPVTAEAVRALSEALYAYRIPVNMTVAATRVFDTSSQVTRLRMDREGKRVLAFDETGTVHVWETGTGKETLTIAAGRQTWADLMTDAGGRILLVSDNEVRCYDESTGDRLWSFDEIESYYADNILAYSPSLLPWCLSADGRKLYIAEKTDWSSDGKRMAVIDTGNGAVLEEMDLSDITESGENASALKESEEDTWYIEGTAVSDDTGRTAVLERTLDDRYRLLLRTDGTEGFRQIPLTFREVYAMGFDCRGQVMICGQSGSGDESRDVPDALLLSEGFESVGSYEAHLACYWGDGSRAWECSIPVTSDNQFSAVFSDEFLSGDTDDMAECDACVLGNAILFADPDTGEEMSSILLPSRIVSAEICAPSVRAVLRSGEMVYLYPDGEKAYLNRYFAGQLEDAAFTGGFLANDEEAAVCTLNEGRREMLLYKGGIGDENYALFEGDTESVKDMFPLAAQTEGGRCVVLAAKLPGWETAVHVLDLEKKGISRIIDLPGEGADYQWADFREESGILTLVYIPDRTLAEGPAKCVQIRVTDGTVTEKEIPVPAGDDPIFLKEVFPGGEAVFLLVSGSSQDTVWRYLPDTGEISAVFTEDRESYESASVEWILPSDSGKHLIVIFDTGEILLQDTDTGEVRYFERDIFRKELPYDIADLHAAWNGDESRFALTFKDAEEICIGASDGTAAAVIPCPGKQPESLHIRDDSVYVLFGDAALESYTLADGTFEERIELGEGDTVYASGTKEWNWTGEHELMVRSGGVLYIADTAAGVCVQKVDGCMGYSGSEKLFLMNFSSYDTEMPYAWYARYEPEDLIRMGREMTDGQPISFEDRIKYALGAESP